MENKQHQPTTARSFLSDNLYDCQWGFTGEIGSAEPVEKTQDGGLFISTVWWLWAEHHHISLGSSETKVAATVSIYITTCIWLKKPCSLIWHTH